MEIKQILKQWEATSAAERNSRELKVKLSIETAAKISALAELFPGQDQDQITSDLLSWAVNELEKNFPYIKSDTVVSEDEFGDPIYADDGLTPKFHELTQKYLRKV